MTDEDGGGPFPWLRPHGRPWTVRGVEPIAENPWVKLDVYDAVAPTGVATPYYLNHFKNTAVGVLPLHDDGTVVLVGQWRFPFGEYSWELPEGGAPKAEDPLAGARRELREEAGLEAAQWRRILTLQLSNASTDEIAYGYLATGLSDVPHDPDPTEALNCARVPFSEALHAAVNGYIQDGITVAMLLRLHHMAVSGDLEASLRDAVLGARNAPNGQE